MRIFITGGTGSLGKALLRKWYCHHELTIYSRDEVKQGELRGIYPDANFMLGDIRNYDWLKLAMRGADVVVHAGAYKQIPAAEVNSLEAVQTNVFGSANVARAAVENEVKTVVGISTDKACAPINCYGESKALMEKLFQQAVLWGETNFKLVRYGNVLGSRGSVVPFFRERVSKCLPIPLTDPNMTRFWLTIHDAVDLVEEAIQIPYSGSILIPRAKASDMLTLAQAVSEEAELCTVGIRPGEKMHEQLVHSNEAMHTLETENNRYIILPAYTNKNEIELMDCDQFLEEPINFTSFNAEQLSVAELRHMLEHE